MKPAYRMLNRRDSFEVCERWKVATRKDSSKPNQKLRRAGREMYRRLCAAFDTGLRAGEMLSVQVKHVDYANWKIKLPWMNAKGGKMTGQDEAVSGHDRPAFGACWRNVASSDRSVYVFGTDEGRKVEKFTSTWRTLFRAAGPV